MVLTHPLDGTPQLPAEVIATMLRGIKELSKDARQILSPMVEQRDELRKLLLQRKWIEKIDASIPVGSVAAVDGAQIQETLYAGDLVVAVAVAAEGLTPAGRLGEATVHSTWQRFTNHDGDNDRLGKVAMVAQELKLLQGLPHNMCILDGSHQTPVIVINSALSSQSKEVRQAALEVLEENNAVSALRDLCSPERGGKIVACPKSDSSRDLIGLLTDRLSGHKTFDLPGTDKVLASLVLEPGEMFQAFRVPKAWEGLHIETRRELRSDPGDPVVNIASQLDQCIQPLRDRTIRITYAKPAGCSTAVKIEFKEHRGADWRKEVCAMIGAETPAPHLQEPFAQHLADQWAKSIGIGVQAQLQGMRLDLAENGAPEFLEYVLRSYRTIGG
ncbi:hypothetical protein [Micromonospora sp. LHW51205]|uniref:hypothetical protein n=1 Tax=Micromonospora sp. LHW51205 TaxID=2248752 RepID=UPI0011BF218F|nr:hypothetical protein [Micromonospora sp. LHW51205]